MKGNKLIKNLQKESLRILIVVIFILCLSNATKVIGESYSSFTLKVSTSISEPILILNNSTSSYTLLKGPYNTSALITVQADTSSASNYSNVLTIISNHSDTLEVNLEVYSYTNLTRILNATIRFRNGTDANFDQIIIENGQIIQDKPITLYILKTQETLYVDIVKLQSNSTGTTYVYAKLKIGIPNKSTFILQTITFKFV